MIPVPHAGPPSLPRRHTVLSLGHLEMMPEDSIPWYVAGWSVGRLAVFISSCRSGQFVCGVKANDAHVHFEYCVELYPVLLYVSLSHMPLAPRSCGRFLRRVILDPQLSTI